MARAYSLDLRERVVAAEARQSRGEKFAKKQTAGALAFELLEKVAAAVTDAAAPLAVEAREQQSTVHIHIHGGPDLPDIRLELDGRRIRDADEDEQCDW